MANQQEGLTLPVVALDELLWEKLILFGVERAGESLREARDIGVICA
jgi:hypothetical protein